jgi:hypothetical protein
MESAEDKSRRQTAKKTLEGMGHVPVLFEGQPARHLKAGLTARDYCRELVKGSEVLLAIVDDTVTEAMKDELEEALRSLGEEHLFYYFTSISTRDEAATELWEETKDSNKLATFSTLEELKGEIRRTVGSFIDDALKNVRHAPEVLGEETYDLKSDGPAWWRFELFRGDRVQATLTGGERFYATFCDAGQFAKLHHNPRAEGMETGTDRSAHYFDRTIEDSGDYYIMVRRSAWRTNTIHIKIRVVRR